MFRHRALITCKRQLKSLEILSFSLMGESESVAKVDNEEKWSHSSSIFTEIVLKSPPPQGFALLPPECRSPPSPLSSTMLSLKTPPQIQKITCCQVGVHRATLLPPPQKRWGHRANLSVIKRCDSFPSEQGHLHPGKCRRWRWRWRWRWRRQRRR